MLDTVCVFVCVPYLVYSFIHPSIHISMTYLATVTTEQDRCDR